MLLTGERASGEMTVLYAVLSFVSLVGLYIAHQTPLSMDFPGKNTRVGGHFLFQGIFLTKGSNLPLLSLLYCQADSWPLCHLWCLSWNESVGGSPNPSWLVLKPNRTKWGAWAQKPFFVPWVPEDRFKHLLIRKGRGCRKKEEQSRNTSTVLGQGPGSSSRGIHNNLWVLLQN